MGVVTKDTRSKLPKPVLRVVYVDNTGQLGPKDTDGRIVDALPLDTRGLERAKEHARWIVDGTLWGPAAWVQERTFKSKWRTIYVYEDL